MEGSVYFITPAAVHPPHQPIRCKIGMTTRDIASRLKELEEESPARLEVRHVIQTRDSRLLEAYLHRKMALHRVIGEWFAFSGRELSLAIEQGEKFNHDLTTAPFESARQTDQIASNCRWLDLSETRETAASVLPIYPRILELLRKRQELRKKTNDIRSRLRSLTGKTLGIEGVTVHTIIRDEPYFRNSDFAERYPELHEKFSKPVFRCDFIFDEPPIRRIIPAPDETRSGPPPRELQGIRKKPARQALALHRQHLEILSESEDAESQLFLLGLQLKQICAQNEGIDGLCTYRRRWERQLAHDALQRSHPELYGRYGGRKREFCRFRVLPYREYLVQGNGYF